MLVSGWPIVTETDNVLEVILPSFNQDYIRFLLLLENGDVTGSWDQNNRWKLDPSGIEHINMIPISNSK